MNDKYLSISKINHYIKYKLDNDENLKKVYLKGEISNFKNHTSGHFYFTLKDETSRIPAVMFRTSASKVNFKPVDGMNVLVTGRISCYEASGSYQIYVEEMLEDGIGNLYVEFEKLKKKLGDLGYFDQKYKKPIPKFPKRIGVITASTGAAIRDIMTTINRRYRLAEVILIPTLVQGEKAGEDIVKSLEKAKDLNLDVIILGRGGGSIEDLWSFNDETLARTIFNLKTPIITGIGHEINFTISDYVADLRAPTPTGAAERCAPDQKDVLNMLNVYQTRLNTAITTKKDHASRELNKYSSSFVFSSPQRLYSEKEMQLVNLSNALYHSVHTYEMNLEQSLSRYANLLTSTIKDNLSQLNLDINEYKNKLNNSVKFIKDKKENCLRQNAGLLDAYSPLKSLARGYAIVEKDGEAIKSTDNLHTDDTLSIQMYDGKIITKVAEIIKEKQHG